MSKDGKKNDVITPVAETSFGPVMIPYSNCMYCFASGKLESKECTVCKFINELQIAGKKYMESIERQIIDG